MSCRSDRISYLRYKYDEETRETLTTVEIIKERRPSNRSIRHQDTDVVAVAVPYAEQGLRQKLKAVGGRWDPEQKVWRVNYRSEGDMAFSDVLTISATILGTLGGGAALVFALSSWLGKVWANRLMEADKANHARELKGLEAALLRDGVDRTRKIEALMHHYERQIEEFYGPLFNMVNQVFVANHIKWELLKVLRGDVAEKVRDYFHETYFIPLHDEIRTIGSSLFQVGSLKSSLPAMR